VDQPGRSESARAAPGRNQTTVPVTSHGHRDGPPG